MQEQALIVKIICDIGEKLKELDRMLTPLIIKHLQEDGECLPASNSSSTADFVPHVEQSLQTLVQQVTAFASVPGAYPQIVLPPLPSVEQTKIDYASLDHLLQSIRSKIVDGIQLLCNLDSGKSTQENSDSETMEIKSFPIPSAYQLSMENKSSHESPEAVSSEDSSDSEEEDSSDSSDRKYCMPWDIGYKDVLKLSIKATSDLFDLWPVAQKEDSEDFEWLKGTVLNLKLISEISESPDSSIGDGSESLDWLFSEEENSCESPDSFEWLKATFLSVKISSESSSSEEDEPESRVDAW